MPYSKHRRITFDCLPTIVTLWATALALVVTDLAGAPDAVGRLGLLAGMAGAAATIVRHVVRTHRLGVQLFSYEARRTRQVVAGLPTQRHRHLRGV